MSIPVRLATAIAILCIAPALAQQKVNPPIATYWMSIDTASGLPMGGAGGTPSMMDLGRMMMGGGMEGGASRSILLELGSQRSAGGTPSATHEIPPGLNMGASLPLETPQRAPRAEPREDGMPENFEKPRGRLLIFWGCGEQAGSGQPYVIDFAKMAQGQVPPGLFGRRINVQRGPSQSRSKTYGDWPNPTDSTRVAADGSLRGEHVVKGNYSPDIRFSLSEKYDFMAPVNLAQRRSGGGVNLSWNSVANAQGYFATAMGSRDGSEDVVFWSSSNSREFGELLMTWLAPAEVARLVREKVVLSPSTTECTVPSQFVKAAPSAFLRFIAYGEEANFAHPPRPQDPKTPWNPEWAVKVRLKSTASALLGEEGGMGSGSRAGNAPAQGGSQGSSGAATPAIDPVHEGIKALRGLFGR
ncbi:MAG: hypothetical protein Q8M53_09290 [Burkholderiales bacterium]|nr:hypothetical protein [Burkholderiales bacterium]MDP3715890.1 hypothetical protein [Burkholderiales bacterium]